MKIDELDYILPPELIATQPANPRDHSRLMVYERASGRVEHKRFCDLPEYLLPSDLLVINNTRVLPAKLMLRKTTGALIPGLYLQDSPPPHYPHPAPNIWTVMLRSRGKLAPGMTLVTDPPSPFIFILLERGGEAGHWIVELRSAGTPESPLAGPLSAAEVLEQIGHVPLPPYIEKSRTAVPDENVDRTNYQTVYADRHRSQSLAAPTAGLHFTPELLEQIRARGIRQAQVTLNVGLGTFLPVETATLEEHKMHTEEYAVPAETSAALREQRQKQGRIVVVGTTATRTLEAAAGRILADNPPGDIRDATNLLISPGYRFQLTDVLITNFHLPRSTLLALVGALVGLEKLKELYALAIAQGYRFYSYGDAMLIL